MIIRAARPPGPRRPGTASKLGRQVGGCAFTFGLVTRAIGSCSRRVDPDDQARLEAQDGSLGRDETGTKIRLALETAGVEFLDENVGGPRVRLRKAAVEERVTGVARD